MLDEKIAKRKKIFAQKERVTDEGWILMNLKEETYDYDKVDPTQAFLSFNLRGTGRTEFVDLFLSFYDKKLIEAIWNRRPVWNYRKKKRIDRGKLKLKTIIDFWL
jgi:hypothetical protein